jgi:hypothetical protein
MKAEDTLVTNLLEGAKQFIVPIFQRDYSWGTKHCQQLWKDVIRVGSDPNVKGHFLGSVVYVAAEDNTATITRWLLIDGQQRMTTLTLLLIALRDQINQAQGMGMAATRCRRRRNWMTITCATGMAKATAATSCICAGPTTTR